MVGFETEVTVTVVKQITLVGVPVIEIFVFALLVFVVELKKAAAPEPSSFFAETAIVTPCAGIVDVMAIVSGKSTCGAAGCTEFTGGVSVTTRFASVGGGGGGGVVDDFFLQPPAITDNRIRTVKTLTNDFLMSEYLIEIEDKTISIIVNWEINCSGNFYIPAKTFLQGNKCFCSFNTLDFL